MAAYALLALVPVFVLLCPSMLAGAFALQKTKPAAPVRRSADALNRQLRTVSTAFGLQEFQGLKAE